MSGENLLGVVLLELDCANGKHRARMLDGYENGRLVSSDSLASPEWEEAEEKMLVACSGIFKREIPTGDPVFRVRPKVTQSRWQLLTITSSKDTIEVDPHSVSKLDGPLKAWTRISYVGTKVSVGNSAVKTSLQLQSFQCGQRQWRNNESVEYDASGSALRSLTNATAWQTAVPGSVGEATLKELCAAGPIERWVPLTPAGPRPGN
jgi:hypothetical protein